MELWIDALLTAVCTLALAGGLWWLYGRLLRPLPARRIQIVLPGRGDGEDLEQTLRALIWLRGLLRCPILIADVDLTPGGWELALRLTARWPDVTLWPAGHIRDCIMDIEDA